MIILVGPYRNYYWNRSLRPALFFLLLYAGLRDDSNNVCADNNKIDRATRVERSESPYLINGTSLLFNISRVRI